MEKGSHKNHFGRFFWLYLLAVILGLQIVNALAIGEGITGIGVSILIVIPIIYIGIYLHNKAFEVDQKNNITSSPFRNLFLPWPQPAILLAIFVFVEFVIAVPLFAYQIDECGKLDLIRKMDGCIDFIPHSTSAMDVALSRDNKILVTYDLDGNLQIWSYPELTLLNTLNIGIPIGTEFSLSSNGEKIAICGYQNAINILETRTGNVLNTLSRNDYGDCDILFTKDDKLVFSTTETDLQIWDVATGKLVHSIPQNKLRSLQISSDDNLLAGWKMNGTINIWRVSDYSPIATLQQQGPVEAIAFSEDGAHLVTVAWDFESVSDSSKSGSSVITIWNISSEEVERTIFLEDFHATSISAFGNGTGFVVGEESCFLRRGPLAKACSYLWKTMNDKIPLSLMAPNGVLSITFSSIDNKIIFGSYNNVYIWQTP